MRRTVLFLNDTHNVPGGAEDQLLRLVDAARKENIDSVVACIPGSAVEGLLAAAGIETAPLGRLRSFPFLAVGEVARLCRRRSIDIIHTGSFLGNFVGRLAGRRVGATVFTSVHCEPDASLLTKTDFLRRLIFRLRSAIDSATSKYTDVFIAVSKAVADKLAAQGIPVDKIHVVHNGVDVPATRRRAAEAAPAVGPEGRSIGLVARLEAVKGIEYLLQATKLLAADLPDVGLVIIGDGSLEGRLKSISRSLGIERNVSFPGYLSNPLPIVAGFDVYVLPSLSEGLNVTLLEAMALERPVVATAVGGNPELVLNGRTGLLVPPRDPQALATAIRELLDDRDFAAGLAGAGAKLVSERFSSDIMCERILSLYRR